MTTQAIAEAKIKLRFREKYLTDGVNEQALAYPRGAYRGYYLAPRPAPDTWLRLVISPPGAPAVLDTDQFAVYGHRDDSTGTDGFSVSIRETTDVEFDLAALPDALFPVVDPTEDWYVYIEATYTPNAPTTANYVVKKTDPHNPLSPNYNPDALILGVIPMTFGATAINFDPIADGSILPPTGIYARRTLPTPAARETYADLVAGDEMWGLLDAVARWNLGTGPDGRAFAEPTVVTQVVPGDIKMQLNGTFYVGKGNVTSPGKYFRLMVSSTQLNMPLIGTDGGAITSYVKMYQSDGATDLNPAVDADAQGFYTNPYVRFDFTNTADVSVTAIVRVLCFKKKTLATLENAPASAFPEGDIDVMGHAARIFAKAHAGSPDSLGMDLLDEQLIDLLALVNARIRTIHPTAAPTGYILLWRSHNVTADANVTKDTVSWYFRNGMFAILVGGYINNATGEVVAGINDDTREVLMQWFGNLLPPFGGAIFGRFIKNDPVAGSSWNMVSGWDVKIGETATANTYSAQLHPNGGIHLDQYNNPDEFIEVEGGAATGDLARVETATLATAPTKNDLYRRYVSQDGMRITCNARWNSLFNVWYNDDTSVDSIQFKFTRTGIVVSRKNAGTYLVGWSDANWDMESTFAENTFSGYGYAVDSVDGDVYDVMRACFSTMMETVTILLQFVRTAVTFHKRWNTVPATVTAGPFISQSVVNGVGDWVPGALTVVSWDGYGAMLEAATMPGPPWSPGDHLWLYVPVRAQA